MVYLNPPKRFYTMNNNDIDLFDTPEKLPRHIQRIIESYGERMDDMDGYAWCKAFLNEINEWGYTFDYGLDAEPFNLKKI